MPLSLELTSDLTLYKSRWFPHTFTQQSSLRYNVVIGVGGNMGDVRRRFDHLLQVLRHSPSVQPIESSPILKNPPFGYLDQPHFFNAVIHLSTSLQPHALLSYLLRLEKRFGRRRSFANAPRTLDLDLLFFEDRVIKTTRLTVPHPHWHKRESVRIPLAYLRAKRH